MSDVQITVQQPPTATVGDVLFVTVKRKMPPGEKQQFLSWLCGALQGTSLERCQVVLLDDDMGVELLRGEIMVT